MYSIMVDIETTGTRIDYAGVIQIAAVIFDPATQDIDTDMFNRCLWLPPNRFWAEDTRDWWNNQKSEVLADIYDRMEDPGTVIREFAEWVERKRGILDPVFWGKPISFDFPFISSYFADFGVKNPFKYWLARDVNTFLEAKTGRPPKDVWDTIPFEGDKHNALCDCVHQIRGIFHAQKGATA